MSHREVLMRLRAVFCSTVLQAVMAINVAIPAPVRHLNQQPLRLAEEMICGESNWREVGKNIFYAHIYWRMA